jgi:hypothetical protein
MGLYRQKLNTRTGAFNLVPSNQVVFFKPGVANFASLPATGNEENDARVTNDTHHLYVWDGTSWIDQGDLIDLTWASIDGKPSSTPANIDDAVSKKHTQNSDTKLAEGTVNEVTAANAKDAVDKKHDQNTDRYLDQGGANETAASEVRNAADKAHDINTDTILKNTSDEIVISDANIEKDLGAEEGVLIDGRDLSADGAKLDTIDEYAKDLETVKADEDIANAISLAHDGSTQDSAIGDRLIKDGVNKITVGTTQPTSPDAGDLWVDTN